MSEWQPIETAPKDGSPMMLWHINWHCPVCCKWIPEAGRLVDFPWVTATLDNRWPVWSFSHWMPMLKEPDSQTKSQP